MVKAPSGLCGEWLSVDDIWHRRLNRWSFVWMRQRVNAAIESSGESEALSEALMRLREIREIGIAHESFTESEVESDLLPDGYKFRDGCPTWADDY